MDSVPTSSELVNQGPLFEADNSDQSVMHQFPRHIWPHLSVSSLLVRDARSGQHLANLHLQVFKGALVVCNEHTERHRRGRGRGRGGVLVAEGEGALFSRKEAGGGPFLALALSAATSNWLAQTRQL